MGYSRDYRSINKRARFDHAVATRRLAPLAEVATVDLEELMSIKTFIPHFMYWPEGDINVKCRSSFAGAVMLGTLNDRGHQEAFWASALNELSRNCILPAYLELWQVYDTQDTNNMDIARPYPIGVISDIIYDAVNPRIHTIQITSTSFRGKVKARAFLQEVRNAIPVLEKIDDVIASRCQTI